MRIKNMLIIMLCVIIGFGLVQPAAVNAAESEQRTVRVGWYFADEEVEWLSKHGSIRVGYTENYLPFCASDPETGKLTGVLNDYLELA